MTVVVLWRMVALHLLRHPLVLVFLPIALGTVPLLQELRPLATSIGALEVVRAYAFPVGLLGAGLALALLTARGPFLQRVDPLTRLLGEWGGVLLASILLQLPIALGALPSRPEGLDLAHALTDILCSDLHLAGLALLALALPMPAHGRLLAFLALAWALPAFLQESARLAPLAALFDASRPLAQEGAAWSAAASGVGLAWLTALRRLPLPAPR